MIPVSVWHTFALPRVTFLVGGKQYGRVGWRVSESPIITYVYRLTGVPNTGGSAIVYIYDLANFASVMVTDRFLHRECNFLGQYIIQAHPPPGIYLAVPGG